MKWLILVAGLCGALALQAQVQGPVLRSGEALALSTGDGAVRSYGAASAEVSMGGLAMLVWLRLEGDEWAAQDVMFRCAGRMGPYTCSSPKGHGKVNLVRSIQEHCTLAFLCFALETAARWKHELDDGPALARLEEVFQPFVGKRWRPGEVLPTFTPEWVGEGDLMRVSPEVMIRWLVDPAQDTLVRRCRRMSLSFFDDLKRERAWWAMALPGPTGSGACWVVGGDGSLVAVLYLPGMGDRGEALGRFRALMGVGPKS